jgi:ABC-type uncharacterized transport system YnjBCD ATPase subunit
MTVLPVLQVKINIAFSLPSRVRGEFRKKDFLKMQIFHLMNLN